MTRHSRTGAMTASLASVLTTTSLLTGCQGSGGAPSLEQRPTVDTVARAGPAVCPRREDWVLDDPRIAESSGVARSHVHPGVIYTHNDRGAPAELFAVDASGTRAVLRPDVAAEDWEDVATTPDGRVWIADIGDNERLRTTVRLAVLQEPDVLASAGVPTTTYDLRYPDGPHDAEALLVHPGDHQVYLVTKQDDGGRVYAAPPRLDAERINVLEYVGVGPPNVTGGAFAPDGDLVAFRNQGKLYVAAAPGQEAVEAPLPSQPQGESITFTADGRHLLVGSEGADSRLICRPVPATEER